MSNIIQLNLEHNFQVVLVNGVRISKTDLDFKNGVVHILDQIIFPPLGNVAVTMKDRDFDAKKFLDAFDMQTINILEGGENSF